MPLASKDLTAPLPTDGTIEHVSGSIHAADTADFSINAHGMPVHGADAADFSINGLGTLDQVSAADAGMTRGVLGDLTAGMNGNGGTFEHVSAARGQHR